MWGAGKPRHLVVFGDEEGRSQAGSLVAGEDDRALAIDLFAMRGEARQRTRGAWVGGWVALGKWEGNALGAEVAARVVENEAAAAQHDRDDGAVVVAEALRRLVGVDQIDLADLVDIGRRTETDGNRVGENIVGMGWDGVGWRGMEGVGCAELVWSGMATGCVCRSAEQERVNALPKDRNVGTTGRSRNTVGPQKGAMPAARGGTRLRRHTSSPATHSFAVPSLVLTACLFSGRQMLSR